jgi:hypothetical protein
MVDKWCYHLVASILLNVGKYYLISASLASFSRRLLEKSNSFDPKLLGLPACLIFLVVIN